MSNDDKSLSHTRWNCKYHLVFTPKYRRKVIYGQLREDIGKIFLKDYRKFKKYWKLFLKDSSEFNYTDYRYQRLFKSVLLETEIMDYLLSLNKGLTKTYKLYQDLLYYCKTNDFAAFSDLLLLSNELISESMVTSVRTLKKHLPRIKNTFRYTFSNGPLEGSTNKIKLIKRIAYGYISFQNYKYRILLSFKDKQISNKSQSAFAA